MNKIDNSINVKPKLKDINEILEWLKEERDNDINGYGFYNNKNIILEAFESYNTIVFKRKDKNIGLLVCSDSEDTVVYIDIFVIHPSYRGKGYGAIFFTLISEYFNEREFIGVKLFCEPKESERFWIKMGLKKYPDCGSYEEDLTYYGALIDTASSTDTSKADKIELWDVEPYNAKDKQPRWIWYVDINEDELLYPVFHPCNCNWNIRWSRNGETIKEGKVKYFTSRTYELYVSAGFLFIDTLRLQ